MKSFVLYLIKFLGGFWVCRKLMRKKRLILAYHGFEIIDETFFRPELFIKAGTFSKRLGHIRRHYNVIPLKDVLKEDVPDNSIVITIDDGWYSTLTKAAPLLESYNYPYTLYLSTQNVINNQPLFHIVLDYLLRSSIGKSIELSYDETIISEDISLDTIDSLSKRINQLKKRSNDTVLLSNIAAALQIDIEPIIEMRPFTMLSENDVVNIHDKGADIQLHTHTHCTFDNRIDFNREILLNIDAIHSMIGTTPEHHCYPSGSYTANSIEFLKELGIKTATTCERGFCTEQSNPLALPRFLDGEHVPQIVFEAHLSGVMEILRKVLRRT